MTIAPYCGWIPPHERTAVQQQAHEEAVLSMPQFRIIGSRGDTDRVMISDCAKACNGGQHFRTFYQKTGSCVGNGGGQVIWHLSAVEAARLGMQITPKLPFYLLPYGRSRYYLNERGQGEGSTGSTFAKAATIDGIVSADTPGLPQWQDQGGITWGQTAEMQWSDGGAISQQWLDKSRQFLVKTTSPVKSAADVRAAIQNWYPCTIASNWGGQMKPSVAGSKYPCLLNTHADTWNHQMGVHAWWNHPELGELFYILNSWGVDVHGQDPAGGQPGGFWVKSADVDYITGQGDSYAFSQFNGFPAQEIERALFKIIGS